MSSFCFILILTGFQTLFGHVIEKLNWMVFRFHSVLHHLMIRLLSTIWIQYKSGILIPTAFLIIAIQWVSEIRNSQGQKKVGLQWSGFWMGSETREANHLKSGQKCPHFEWSGFWMVETIAMAKPFENQIIWNLNLLKSGYQMFLDLEWSDYTVKFSIILVDYKKTS